VVDEAADLNALADHRAHGLRVPGEAIAGDLRRRQAAHRGLAPGQAERDDSSLDRTPGPLDPARATAPTTAQT